MGRMCLTDDVPLDIRTMSPGRDSTGDIIQHDTGPMYLRGSVDVFSRYTPYKHRLMHLSMLSPPPGGKGGAIQGICMGI